MAAPRKTLLKARRPFQYDTDLKLDIGQVFELRGYRNDEKLERLGYIEKITERNPALSTCGECEAQFVSSAALDEHGQRNHRARVERLRARRMERGEGMSEDAGVDVTGDREERELEARAPLYMENTTASRT